MKNTSYRCEGGLAQKTGEEKPKAQFWLLFLCFFSSPKPALCKLGWPEELFILPEVLTLVLGPSFVLFLLAFPFFVFSPLPFWTLFSYSNYLLERESI